MEAKLGEVSRVARATGTQPSEEKIRLRVVDAAMTPRDYVNQFLDEHPEFQMRVIDDLDYGYRDLAADISAHFGMDFDHTTVYRAVKKRRN